MKKLLMSLMMCVSVAACESMPSTSALDNFSWASFNPFSEREPVREVKFRQTEEKQIPTPPPSGDALQTELQEIEKLTGNRPQEATPPPASEYAAVLTIAQETNVPMQTATLANEKTAMVPAKKPASSPRMPKENIVAKASWSEAEPAPAAPQGEVKAIPTKDSIRWNQSARPMPPAAPVIAAPQPVPTYMQPTQPTPTAPQATDNTSSVQSLAVVLADKKPSSAKGCPQLRVLPEARSMTNFENDGLSGTMTSRASITDIRGGCEPVKGGMEIDLQIVMQGAITNAGRYEGNPNLEAFVTFPYFVTVTSPSGTPLDKQIMATAMRFQPARDNLDHAEEYTLFIPMEKFSEADKYVVTVGFQLSRKHLEYNRAQTMMRTDNVRVSPDIPAPSKRSVNPLAE